MNQILQDSVAAVFLRRAAFLGLPFQKRHVSLRRSGGIRRFEDMKRIFVLIVACGIAVVRSTFSQGEVLLLTTGSEGAGYMRFSNTVTRTWAAEGIVAGLYWGTDAVSVTNLVPRLATLSSGFITPLTAGGVRVIAEQAGIRTYFQLKAWSSGFGSWEEAVANGASDILVSTPAQSPIAAAIPTAGPLGLPPGIPWGGTSANPIVVEVGPVPEPSVWALAALGALCLGVFARLPHRPRDELRHLFR